MQKADRLIENNAFPELEFAEREATPEPAMQLGIQMHLAELSLSDTVSILSGRGGDRARFNVHKWVKKAVLQPIDGKFRITSPSTRP